LHEGFLQVFKALIKVSKSMLHSFICKGDTFPLHTFKHLQI